MAMPVERIESDNGTILTLNPDATRVAKIWDRCIKNDGYCPCTPNRDEDHICPCKKARTVGTCCCTLYVQEIED